MPASASGMRKIGIDLPSAFCYALSMFNSSPSLNATKQLTSADVIGLMSSPTVRDLLTVQTSMGFDTVYGFMLYAVAEIRLYWVPGQVEAFVIVRHLTGVDIQLATAVDPWQAAETFNAHAFHGMHSFYSSF